MTRGHDEDVKLLVQRPQRFEGTIHHWNLCMTLSLSSYSIDKEWIFEKGIDDLRALSII